MKKQYKVIGLVCIFILILLNVIVYSYMFKGSKSRWNLILVNEKNKIPDDYSVDLAEIQNGIYVDERIQKELLKMLDSAEKDGVYLEVVSGYRTEEEQEKIYEEKVAIFMDEGYKESDAKILAKQWAAVPGTSEHQTGLAVDINVREEKCKASDAYQWLADNAAEYGFICRYPQDKIKITGITNEPWHYRYVGEKAAKKMKKDNLCLEEFLQ